MADFFVDDTVVGGLDDGTSWDINAFNTAGGLAIKTALESAGYVPGDKPWVRRTTIYDEAIAAQNADITPNDDGTAAAPIEFIGWPRPPIPNTEITAADWTNGSTIIDNVVGIAPVRECHQARYVTAPDGHQYLITAILWEITVDGMGAGDEFTVGSLLNHTGNTRKGTVYTFVDNLDTTGTIQAVLDAEQTWDNGDNITDADGGDAELDANATAVGFVIDREYAGATVTGVTGKFQIEADEDYATRPDVGALRATWDADALNLPIIDFNNEAYQLYFSIDNFYILRNFEVKDSNTAEGIIRVVASSQTKLIGCLFKQNSNNPIIHSERSGLIVKRFIGEGSGVGATQRFTYRLTGEITFIDGAIYNMGDSGIASGNYLDFNNINIGIEIANGNDDILLEHKGFLFGKDIKLGGTNGFAVFTGAFASPHFICSVMIENYQKVLGDHRMFYPGGIADRAAVAGETPNKKLSDHVLKITPNVDYTYKYEEGQCVLFEHEYQLNAGANTIKYWLYNDVGAILNNGDARADIYLVAEYVDSYDDTSEYTITKAYSTEHTIAQAADADDWDFLSATMILAAASKVRVRLLISYYDLTGDIFIDAEKPVINGLNTEGFWSYGLSRFKANLPDESDVRDAVDYDFGDKTGDLELPLENDVEDGVGYGSLGTEYEGNFEAPSENDVEDGVGYGSNGTEYEGNFEAPSEDDVEDGVKYGSLGTEYEGNFEAPDEDDVRDEVTYGANGTEFTGSLTFLIADISVVVDGGLTMSVSFKQKEAQTVRFTVTDATDAVVDLSTATLTFAVKKYGAAAYAILKADATFDKTQAALGIVTVPLSATDLDLAQGEYGGELKMYFSAANIDKSADITVVIKQAMTT